MLAVSSVMGQQSPNLKEIVQRFYQTYDLPFNVYPRAVFEKKLDKWYIGVLKQSRDGNYETRDVMLYYDAAKGYQILPLEKTSRAEPVDFNEYFDEWTTNNYNLHPYYGYTGWYKDVIALYTKKNSLSDDELYSLGRAYSAHASSMMNDLTLDALKEEMFKCPFSINCLNEDQIKKYNLVIEAAQKSFSTLATRNPSYQTAVGPIAIKNANEHLVQFHSMLTFADNYALSMQLPDNLYPDSVINKSISMLSDCPLNAILVSFGDNDFYPLLYLQQKKKLRRDVHIVHYSLLGVDDHIFRATQPQFDAKGIDMALDTMNYRGNTNDVVVIESRLDSIDFIRAIDIIKNGQVNEVGLKTIPSRRLLLKTGKGKVAINLDKHYLLKNDIALLDIIQNLNGRKLCFTYDEYTGYISDYLVKRGLIWIFDR